MTPLLPPEAPAESHRCAPPTYPAALPGGQRVATAPRVTPAEGSTWDCPACRAVWVVRPVRQPRFRWGAGHRPHAIEWRPAPRAVTRRHYDRLATYPSPPSEDFDA